MEADFNVGTKIPAQIYQLDDGESGVAAGLHSLSASIIITRHHRVFTTNPISTCVLPLLQPSWARRCPSRGSPRPVFAS